jgi:A/G-specific adenine glycosylase
MLALEAGLDPDEPPVDGNIARVLTRVIGASWEKGEPRKKKQIRDAARAWLSAIPTPHGRLQLAYALVDLGSLLCTPRNPRCSQCPISNRCVSPQ